MALKYQFNKISLNFLNRQLKIREKALPILESKESALRLTIKKQKVKLNEEIKKYEDRLKSLISIQRLWPEFPMDLFNLKNINLIVRKIASIKTPQLEKTDYEIREFSRFLHPAWFEAGISILKGLTEILIEIEVLKKGIDILEYARKKTTQKVNLYKKVQIPAYYDAVRKIKRFMEDADNLDKSSQKITKKRQDIKGTAI